MQRGFLEIRCIGRKDLPARHWLSEHLNGAHIRKFPPQTLVMFLGGCEPHSVVRRRIALVAENQDNLVLHIDCKAAKHGARLGRERGDRVEHELMRDGLALDRKGGFAEWESSLVATGF